MSLINKFKSLPPISSRSFHAAEKHFVTQNNLVKDVLFDIKLKQDELFRRIEQADNGINENINAKYDAIDASLRTEAERNRLRMEALMKRALPGRFACRNSSQDFSLLSEAEGNAHHAEGKRASCVRARCALQKRQISLIGHRSAH